MKILKRILFVLIGLVALLLITALFMKKEYTVEREVTINKPRTDVFAYIIHLKNQTQYSKWVMMDRNAKLEYGGTEGEVGSWQSWDSQNKNVGAGKQTISKITDGERMDLAIHFLRPFEGDANAWMTTSALGENQTRVSWAFHSKMPYPMNIMQLFMDMDKMLGDDIQEGLNNLKHVLEK